ncbi:MAG: hypothetical protein IJ640_07970 [Prevotella sp.]|nr:hypothetical protein [Prevotella sp.]
MTIKEMAAINAAKAYRAQTNFEDGAYAVLKEFEPLIATLRTGARALFEAKVKELKGE